MKNLFAAYGVEELNVESATCVDTDGDLTIAIQGHSSEIADSGVASRDGITLGYVGKIYNHAQINSKTVSTDVPNQLIDLYLNVGATFLDLIIGPLAIVIYDPYDDIFLFGRDKTGINPLFYSTSNDAVFVSTTMEALLNHGSAQADVNKQFIAEVLSHRVKSQTETFYTDIHRVKHGQYIQFDGDISTVDYWTPTQIPTSYESWAAVLGESVCDRVQDHDHVGIKMSGGLDSTTITALCCDTQASVNSYSKVIEKTIPRQSQRTAWNREQQRMEAMVDKFDITPHTITIDTDWPLKNEARYRGRMRANPLIQPTMAIKDRFGEEVTKNDTILLTGHGGNMVDGDGYIYYDLVSNKEPKTFVKNSYHDKKSLVSILINYVLYPMALRRSQMEQEDICQSGIDVLTNKYSEILNYKKKKHSVGSRLELQQAYDEYYYSIRDFRMLASRRHAIQLGIDIRYPYLDSRMFEYIFNTEMGELYSNGEAKGGFIAEFEDLLPNTVLDQDNKAYFTPLYTTALQKMEDRINDLLTNSTLEQLGIVDPTKMRMVKQRPEELKGIWELINIELWLQSPYANC